MFLKFQKSYLCFMTLTELEKYFKDKELPETAHLHESIHIIDVPKFVESHLTVIRAYPGGKTSEPFKLRLENLIAIFEGKVEVDKE